MIERVVGFGAKFERGGVLDGQAEFAMQAEIDVVDAGSAQDVAARIAEQVGIRGDKAGSLEVLLQGRIGETAAAGAIGVGNGAGIGVIEGENGGKGQSGLRLIDGGQLPAPGEGGGPAGFEKRAGLPNGS